MEHYISDEIESCSSLRIRSGEKSAHKRDRRRCLPGNIGKVYTPSFLADWVATVAFENLPTSKSITVLDPACGEGELLLAAKRNIKNHARLIGVDIDLRAIESAAMRIKKGGVFINSDALIPKSNHSFLSGWRDMLSDQRIDVILANPPWGADLAHNRADLTRAGYSLAKGQFDSWELFVELSLCIVAPGGMIVFIVPDAIFLPEHEPLRRVIQDRTTIHLIARLGEGFFPSVYRGTTVLVARNEPCDKDHRIEVFRLNKTWRDEVLSFSKSLDDARKGLRHYIFQKRFCEDKYHRWDIDTHENEWTTIRLISSSAGEWVKWLKTGRGIELSKFGMIICCPKCHWAMPNPRQPRKIKCFDCGHAFNSKDALESVAVRLKHSLSF